MRLAHHDIQRLNEAIVHLYRLGATVGPLRAVAATLPRALGGVVSAVDLSCRDWAISALSESMDLPDPSEHFEKLREHPRARRSQPGTVVKISDYLSKAQWHKLDLYYLVRPILKFEDDLGVDLRLPNGDCLRACVLRESRSFREEDRQIFTLLLPHFISLLSPPSSQQPTLEGLGLTAREQEVLLRVSEGKTNAEMAQILYIAPGTVKIHLERIYKKLGVTNRHGAARRALEALNPNQFRLPAGPRQVEG